MFDYDDQPRPEAGQDGDAARADADGSHGDAARPQAEEPIHAEFATGDERPANAARDGDSGNQRGFHDRGASADADASDSRVRSYLEPANPGQRAADFVFQAELADEAAPDEALEEASPLPPRKRRVVLPVMLFLLTCLSTFIAGACVWWPSDYLLSPPYANDLSVGTFSSVESPLRRVLLVNWSEGLVYTFCVLAILLTHEMGHFLATVRYRIPASLPFFLPFPLAPLGTLGAVIAMDGRRANRKETFDIGIAGPLAGLAVALPVLWIGVGHLDATGPAHGMFQVEPPLVAKWMLALRQPEGYVQGDMIWQSQLNPFLMAGWFGMIITGVNMMPVSQLDGGHVIYTLFGKKARWIARGFIVLTIVAMIMDWVHQGLFLMVLMILLIGIDHPPTRDDSVPLGTFRKVLGCLSLAIPFLCFAPRLFHS